MRFDPETRLQLGPAAAEAEHELVWRLSAYLRDGQATARELVDAVGMSPRALEMLVGVGLLEPAPQVGTRCERCGAPVRLGPLCARCRAGLAAPLAAGEPSGAGHAAGGDDPVARAIAAARAARRAPGSPASGPAPAPRRVWTRHRDARS